MRHQMEEERPKKKVKFAETLPKSTRHKIYDAIEAHNKEKTQSLLNSLKKDIPENLYDEVIKIVLFDINTYAQKNQGYDRNFIKEVLQDIISTYSKEAFIKANIKFIFMMCLKYKDGHEAIVKEFSEDRTAVIEQASGKSESTQAAINASPGGADGATTHGIGLEPDENRVESKKPNSNTEPNNSKYTFLSFESLLGQYFSWVENLPQHLQNQIKSSYIYKAITDSIENSLRIFILSDISFKFSSNHFEENNYELTTSDQELILITNITQKLIDIDTIYNEPIPFYTAETYYY